jgi:hypothetical protein
VGGLTVILIMMMGSVEESQKWIRHSDLSFKEFLIVDNEPSSFFFLNAAPTVKKWGRSP